MGVRRTSDLSYETWMGRVDAACGRLAGVSVHDLADCCFVDMYEDGFTPAQAARAAIRADQE